MPNVRISNTGANIRIRDGLPSVRISSYQTGILVAAVSHPAGMPIGLLLALTYAGDITDAAVYRGDQRPNVNIK